MKTLDTKKDIIFMGDNHGEYQDMFSIIKFLDIENCYFIHLGDGGEGFIPLEKQLRQFNIFNEFFKARDIQYMSIRGNHSDPFYFKGENRVALSNFELIEDYTVMQYGDKLIQFIGGATSIDRVNRNVGTSYWEDEGLFFDRDKCQKVDILITHTAPSRCFPQQFTQNVYDWANRDAYLLEDLTEERVIMDEIFKICDPSLHLYGHFHYSVTETIENCKHKLLNINELWSYNV